MKNNVVLGLFLLMGLSDAQEVSTEQTKEVEKIIFNSEESQNIEFVEKNKDVFSNSAIILDAYCLTLLLFSGASYFHPDNQHRLVIPSLIGAFGLSVLLEKVLYKAASNDEPREYYITHKDGSTSKIEKDLAEYYPVKAVAIYEGLKYASLGSALLGTLATFIKPEKAIHFYVGIFSGLYLARQCIKFKIK